MVEYTSRIDFFEQWLAHILFVFYHLLFKMKQLLSENSFSSICLLVRVEETPYIQAVQTSLALQEAILPSSRLLPHPLVLV